MQDLEIILAKFQEIVSPDFCNALAKRHGLVKRSSSRMQGYELAQAMMIPNGFVEAETLNSLAVRMQGINKTCNLSASALAQRINTPMAKSFMRACFLTVLKEVVKKEFDCKELKLRIFAPYKRVLIEDSTRAELHEKLSPAFKGSGGVASKASVKIDFIFDYQSEEFVDMHFCSGNKPDQSLAGQIIQVLSEGDLVIRDLGYFAIERFKEIEEAGAHYISRWKVNEDVYASRDAKTPVDLARFISENMVQGMFEKEVFIGKERRPVRMVACEVSEEALIKRRRNANQSARRHGVEMSAKKRNLLKFAVFITNIPVKVLCSEDIMAIYRVRWRIELIFKQWKSCLHFHIFKGYNEDRFHCLLYGRLTMILLIGKMYPILMNYAIKKGKEVSGYKLTNYLVADHNFARALQNGKIEEFIEQLRTDILRRLCMDKRKRCSLRDNVKQGNGYYKDLEVNALQIRAA